MLVEHVRARTADGRNQLTTLRSLLRIFVDVFPAKRLVPAGLLPNVTSSSICKNRKISHMEY